jgi:hypothetical protein
MLKTVQSLAVGLACLTAAGTASAANLTAGSYGVSSYYTSATGAGGGTCDIFPKGTYLSSEYTYPGPNKPGATSRTFINGPSPQYVLLQTYPTTPPNGATSWSGSVTDTFLPGGTPTTGSFSTTYTVTDAKSYIDTTTYVFPSNGGTCTSVVQHVGIWSGK